MKLRHNHSLYQIALSRLVSFRRSHEEMKKNRKYVSVITWFFYAYPILVVGSLYVTWFVAWSILGHQPRPSLDDPKYIGVAVDIPYVVTMILILASPGALVVGIGLTPLYLSSRISSRFRLIGGTAIAILLLALLWCAPVGICRLDPWNVGMWFMD